MADLTLTPPASPSRRGAGFGAGSSPARHRWGATVFLAGLVALSVWALVVIAPMARAEVMLLRTRWQIDQWINGFAPYPGMAAWGQARNTLADAIAVSPHDPQTHEALAYLYASRAQLSEFDTGLALAFYQQAEDSYRQSIALRPMAGVTWANLALVRHRMAVGQPASAALWQAFDQAMAYALREPAAQLPLTDIALSRWTELSPERREAVQRMLTDHVNIQAQQPLYDLLTAQNRLDLAPDTWEAARSHLMPEFGTEVEYWPRGVHDNRYRDPATLVDERTRRINRVLEGKATEADSAPPPTEP